MSAFEIVAPGWATTVQDAGRPGWADIGVAVSGALDSELRDLLNRLVGNPVGAAVLETLGGLTLRASAGATVATAAERAPRAVVAGETIAVDPAAGMLWGYLAVRGGIDVAPVLGSRSQDSRSGLGPPTIAAGRRLPIGSDPGTTIVVDHAPPRPPADVVAVWPGPRQDWFEPSAMRQLTATTWTVSADVSRVGALLEGPPLARLVTGELPSEGVLTGAIQVPPDGGPVVMLADHPTTGGYPVLAIVDIGSLATVVQARPGTHLRFGLRR